jgi:predicted nucleic acid-binding protein
VRLVADASVLVGELLRARGRQLLANRTLQIYVPEGTWDETVHELRNRTDGIVRQGRLSRTIADELLAAAIALVETAVVIVPEEVYGTVRDRALRRLPRDPEDWPTVALAR